MFLEGRIETTKWSFLTNFGFDMATPPKSFGAGKHRLLNQ